MTHQADTAEHRDDGDMSEVAGWLEQLTLQEKASLVRGSSFWRTQPVPRLGVPSLLVSDGPHGLRVQPAGQDHLGIGGSNPATCFPTASAIASSWDTGLLYRVGVALGDEARASNLSVILGPGVNMKRSPLCGRNFEYFSEDPFLAGELAVGIVDGIQSRGVGTSVKHFAANNQETERLRVDTQVDERTLREIYLPAFERVVTGSQPWTVMCSYNKINGLSASENPWLLHTVLREEMGFAGAVVSDWGATYHRVPALAAGLDLEMPSPQNQGVDDVVAAVRSGALDEAVLDERVRHVLELVLKGRHVLDLDEQADFDAHHALAREAAAASVVLLTNDGGLLPLAAGTSVAVIGELARTPRYQGAGSSQVVPTRLEDLLGALTGPLDVTFAPGYGLGADDTEPASLRADAARVAAAAEVAVVVLGLPAEAESEGFDRTHMDLPADQLALLAEVAQANPRTVVVLANGSTVVLGDVLPHAQALVETWLGGQAAGSGIADVLLGRVNPSGRLAETIPHRLQDNSSYLQFPGEELTVRYGEGVFIGYRGYDRSDHEVAFPFGYGLSYTSFTISDLHTRLHGSVQDGDLGATVTAMVTNTGDQDGAHIVQVYVADPESTVSRPVRELKGFTKVALAAGESRQVRIELDQRAFSYWSARHRRWVVEAGEFVIDVANNSRDIVASQRVVVQAPFLAVPLTAASTLHEWMADPVGRELVVELFPQVSELGEVDPGIAAMLGSAPVGTLADFGMAASRDTVQELVARAANR